MFLNIIAAHPVFTSLPELFDFLLESIEAVQYMPEQYVFKEGAKATHLYVLENGQCEVLVKGSVLRKEIHVSEIEPGCIFGEVALINGVRRTASVRSKVHCTVGAIREESF
jgi:CRP-like cAMP-binding protein